MTKNEDLSDKDISNLSRYASLYYEILERSNAPTGMSQEEFVLDFTKKFLAAGALAGTTTEDLKSLPARIRRQEKLLGISPSPGRKK